MVATIEELNSTPCPHINAKQVDAYFCFYLDEENPSILHVDDSWGSGEVDLTPAVRASETVTTLELVPTNQPLSLQYTKEDKTVDCITGDELSGIISMTKLKDVATTPIQDGEVYQYNGMTEQFEPFNLKNFVTSVNNILQKLQAQVDANTAAINNFNEQLQQLRNYVTNQISALNSRLTVVEAKLTPPAGVPSDVSVTFGNINEYSDYTNSNRRTSGFYTHNPNSNRNNDLMSA